MLCWVRLGRINGVILFFVSQSTAIASPFLQALFFCNRQLYYELLQEHDPAGKSEQETGGDDPDNNGAGQRKSCCSCCHVSHPNDPLNRRDEIFGAELNEANVLPGKRRREAVDYRKQFTKCCLFWWICRGRKGSN